MVRYPPMKNSSYRGRRTPEQISEEAKKKAEAKAQIAQERRNDRDDLGLRLIGVIESLRTDENLDARRIYKLEIDFNLNGGAVVILHSRVFPSYKHMVPASTIQEAVENYGYGKEEESEGFEPTGEFCSVCNSPQFHTPSGVSCKEGHGGAPGKESQDDT